LRIADCLNGAKPRNLRIVLAVVILLAAVVACDNSSSPAQPAAPNTYRIVSSLPSKGIYAREARLIRQGIDLQVERARADGILLEHVALDGGDPESGQPSRQVEMANAQRAVSDPAVIAYIGPWTSEATGWSLPITSKAGLLHVGVTATWPGLTQDGWDAGEPGKYYEGDARNYVRLVPPDSLQATRAARWMRFIGVTQAVAIEDGSSYSQGLARGFLEEWEAITPQDDARSISLQVYLGTEMAPGPRPKRAFFFAASTVDNAIALSRAVAEKEPEALIFFTDNAMRPEFAEALGRDHSTWNRFVAYNGGGLQQTGAMLRLADLYYARYGEELSAAAARAMGGVELIAYGAAQLSTPGMSTGEPPREIVLNSLKAFSPLGLANVRLSPSALDEIEFDENGDNIGASLEAYVVTNGGFRFVRRLTSTRP
jgi:branched-chain amino acid transport system substrate-binding protein